MTNQINHDSRGEVRAVIVHGPANAIHEGVVSEIDGIR